MSKDWTGGKASIFKTIGATGHCGDDRQREDYYATEPRAMELLCDIEQFSPDILEPSCGEGHISKVLQAHGYNVTSRDLIDRGYGEVADFLAIDNLSWHGDIITNPPYKYAQEFVEKALRIIPEGHKVAMFLKLTFLEGKSRKELFKITPPHTSLGIILSPQVRYERRLQSSQWLCHRLRMVRVGERMEGRYGSKMVQLGEVA